MTSSSQPGRRPSNVIKAPQALAKQTVPYSQEAEEAALGALLVNDAQFPIVAGFLKAEDFFLLRNAYIFQAMTRIHERGEPIDYVMLVEELKNLGRLDEIGGPAYLTHLSNQTPTSLYAEVYAHLVERAAIRRRLLAAADEIKGLALNEELAIDAVCAESETSLQTVTDRAAPQRISGIRENVQDYWDQWERVKSGAVHVGLPTGFTALDELLVGLQRGDFTIIAAIPSMGKTAFVLSLAWNVATLYNARVGVFSMEMSRGQVTQRLLSIETEINLQKVRTWQGFSALEEGRLVEGMGRVSELPVHIDDTSALTPSLLRALARRWALEGGLDLIVVDYAQLMRGGERFEGRALRTQEMDYVAYELKAIAKEFDIPVLAAAQLNRDLFDRQDKRPRLDDLRESGAWEQAADNVVFIHRESAFDAAYEFPNQADFIVAKQRNGPTGTISLYWEAHCARFKNGTRIKFDDGKFPPGSTHAAMSAKED